MLHSDCVEVPRPITPSSTENESPSSQVAFKNISCSARNGGGHLQGESIHVSISVPSFAVLRSDRHSASQIHRKNFESYDIDTSNTLATPEQSVYLNYAPEPTVWPLIIWPQDFWVISAAFLFAGLETTYGAFIHSFTLTTLRWPPVGLFNYFS